MANWQGLILTKKGQALMAKVEAGATLDLTKLKLGSGVLPEGQNLEELTDLITPEQILGIAAKEAMLDEEGNYTGLCQISSTISNAELTAGYYVRELGVFANDPDEGEILYAITTDTAPDYLPAAGGATVISQEFAVYIAISNAESITAKIDIGALATMGYVQLAIKTHNEDDTAHADFVGASTSKEGNRGFVPKPAAGEEEYVLAGKGVWVPQSYSFIPLVKRNTAYKVDEIATGKNLPAGTFLRCTAAGTTAADAPEFSPSATAGTTYTDGGVTWVVDSYLPTSGGKMRGSILADLTAIKNYKSGSRISLYGGMTSTAGASLYLCDNLDKTNPGQCVIALIDTDGSAKFLTLRPDGVFAWNGKQIVRSVDNINADLAGNVALNAMSYKKLSSIKSVKGCFWADSNSGININEMPAGWSGTDWAMWQIGMLNGSDKMQFAFSGPSLYYREDDNTLGSETWTQASWKKILTENNAGWTVSKGTNGWARDNSTGFTFAWGKVSNAASATLARTFTTIYGGVATPNRTSVSQPAYTGGVLLQIASNTKINIHEVQLGDEQYNSGVLRNFSGAYLVYGVS